MTEKKHAQHFAFIDVETTGLVRTWDRLVEVGCVITDFNLKQVGPSFQRVVATTEMDWHDSEATQMHKASGLYQESIGAGPGTVDKYKVVSMLLCHIAEHAPSVVVHVGLNPEFDASFLSRHCADGCYFDFRNIDVLALRRTVRSCIGEHALPPIPKAGHRVLTDIRHCMDEFRYYIGLLKDGFHPA